MSLWTTKLVRPFLDIRFGVEYCRERVRHLRPELGFRWRRVRHRPLQAKPEAQVACQAELAEWVVEWPEDDALLCVDEATVWRHPTLTAPWGVVEDEPEVPTGDDPTKVHVDGAVAPLTGRTHDHVSPALGQGELAPFLRHLLAYDPGKQLLVIHDRGAQPKGGRIEEVVREAAGRLVLKPQPAYSLELNPQAHVQGTRLNHAIFA